MYYLFCTNVAKAQTTEPYSWGNVAIGGGGFVSGIITSKTQPGLMYARTDVGGAYRWDIANSKWIPLVDFASENTQGYLGVQSLATDPLSPSIVYIAAGISYFNGGKSYIMRSADYGATFTVTDVTSQFKINGNALGRGTGEKLQVDPNNSSVLYCGTQSNGLFKSTNSGSTWSNVSSLNVTTTANGNGISFVVLDKSSASGGTTQRIFAGISRTGSSNNLYKSEDGGSTFSALINPNLGAGLMPLRAVLSGNNASLFITYANGSGPYGTTAEPCNAGEIWKYTLADGSWTNITPLSGASRVNKAYCGISVDPNNPSRLVASTTNTYDLQYGSTYGDKIYYSTDGGSNWTDVVARGFSVDANGITWVPGQSIHWAACVEFDPSNTNKVYVVSGNGLYVNEDINASAGIWKFNVKGLEETVPLNIISIKNGPFFSVIGDYDGFRHTDAAQYAPIHNPRMGSTGGLDYAVNNSNKLVRVGGSMYYSNDQGITWTKVAVLKGTGGQVALSADGSVLLHCPDNSTTTYRSTDNGSTWTTVTGLNINNARPVADGSNSNKFYAYNNNDGSLMVSTDGGVSFNAAANSTNSYGSRIIRTIPGREGTVWVALYNGGLAYTEDGGATPFQKINGVTTCSAVGMGKALTVGGYETIFIWGTVGGVTGLHRSTDKGVTWVRVNDDAHQYGGPANGQFVMGDKNIYGRVYLSTAGRGIAYGSTVASLLVSPGSLNYSSGASSQLLTVTANQTWTVTADQTWLTLSATGGNGNGSFTVAATANTGSAARTATLTLIGGNITKTVSVSQNGTSVTNPSAPAVTSVSPTTAIAGTTVTITGTDFTGTTAVSFGGVAATSFTLVSPTSITAVVGAGGNGNVGVTTPLGTGTLAGFNYVPVPTISTGSKSIPSGGSIMLTAMPGTGYTYQWIKDGVNISGATNASYTATLAGSYTVSISLNGLQQTSAATVMSVMFGLPTNNFKVSDLSATCKGTSNGSINITAAQHLNYTATITATGLNTPYTFTDSVRINNLAAGTYNVCLTVTGQPTYQQCFIAVITEPKDLSVYTATIKGTNQVVLSMSGSNAYNVSLNGKAITTTSGQLTLTLNKGSNTISVSTDKLCQGEFTENIVISDDKLVYPNPFETTIKVNLGKDNIKVATIHVYDLYSRLVYSGNYANASGVVEINLSGLVPGVYMLNLTADNKETAFKIIKK